MFLAVLKLKTSPPDKLRTASHFVLRQILGNIPYKNTQKFTNASMAKRMPTYIVPLQGMSWKRWGLKLGLLSFVLGQGAGPMLDSLVVENERIEQIELGAKPLPTVPKFSLPTWSEMERLPWQAAPAIKPALPATIGPTRPTWPRLAPLHLSYSLGRFLTQEAQLVWNRTRDLSWDSGLRLYHFSTLQGHLPQARWGQTQLEAWGGYHTATYRLRAQYSGGYEKYRLYAPYAEGWPGYQTPIPDSLYVHYWRQHLQAEADILPLQLRLVYRTQRTDFRTGVPEWLHFLSAQKDLALGTFGKLVLTSQFFTEGSRYLVAIQGQYERSWSQFQLRSGLYIGYGAYRNSTIVVAPIGQLTYQWRTFLRPFIENRAELRPISYFWAVEQNPYLGRQRAVLPFTKEWAQTLLGFSGQGRGWEYRLAGEYRLLLGAPLFVPQGPFFQVDTLRRFESWGVVFEGLFLPAPTSPYVEIQTALRQWSLKSVYPSYFGQAPWEFRCAFGYQKTNRLRAQLAIYALAARYLDPLTKASTYVDISWKVEAQVLPVLSFFVEMNNLLNRPFYRWAGYRERPLDLRIGLWTKIG